MKPATGCWLWSGSTNRNGYGRKVVREGRRVRTYLVHRLVWEALRGPVPEGRILDHLCRNRRCCNPDHLEPVTHRQNTLRGHGSAAVRWRTARREQKIADTVRARFGRVHGWAPSVSTRQRVTNFVDAKAGKTLG